MGWNNDQLSWIELLAIRNRLDLTVAEATELMSDDLYQIDERQWLEWESAEGNNIPYELGANFGAVMSYMSSLIDEIIDEALDDNLQTKQEYETLKWYDSVDTFKRDFLDSNWYSFKLYQNIAKTLFTDKIIYNLCISTEINPNLHFYKIFLKTTPFELEKAKHEKLFSPRNTAKINR